MKTKLFILCLCLNLGAKAQESSSVFNFLKIPVSAHAAALGGDNVSVHVDDPTLVFNNPAMAAQVNDMSFNLNYMTYLSDANVLSASFIKVFSVRHTVALTGQLLNYGDMQQTDEDGNILGDFSPSDCAISALYSYTMGNGLVGGATLRFISSSYGDYTSTALSVDVGLHYYNDAHDFAAGLVLRNMGAQLSSFYEDEREHLPFDLQAGITQKIQHAPFRISITLKDLTRWDKDYYYRQDGAEISTSRMLLNHLCLGIDFLPFDGFYIAAGYNFRRASELKAAGSSHAAGFSLGAGAEFKGFKLSATWAKYHVSVSSLLFNLSYSINKSAK